MKLTAKLGKNAPSSPTAAPEEERSSRRRELLVAWVHLGVLWAFAFAKPLFDVLEDSPGFFVARGNTRGDILLFAIGMIVIAPTVMVLLEALLARWERARMALHLFFVAALMAAFALQVLEDVLPGSGGVVVAAAVVVGLAGTLAYARTRAVPTILSVLGPAPLLFLVIFLLFSPVSKLVLPQKSAEAADLSVPSKTPVVLVVFDEFDSNMIQDAAGRIDRTRYPNFAAFGDDATWYRNATTVSDSTIFAVPAVLTGRRPDPDSVPVASDYPHSIFTLLGGSYALNVRETATELCPESLCGERAREPFGRRVRSLVDDLGVVSLHLLLPDDLRSGLPAVDQTFSDFGGGGGSGNSQQSAQPSGGGGSDPGVPSTFFRSRTKAFGDLLEGMRPNATRTLDFLHAPLPHEPWQYLPTGQQYPVARYDITGLQDGTWVQDPALPRQGLQRHLLQTGYVDRLVGGLIRRLRATGVYDDAMVILTADHGASYRPGLSRRTMTMDTAGDIAGVPLLIKYPRERRGRIDDSMVRTIDILPTIADELGVQVPWKVDGRPIARAPDDGPVRVAVGGTGDDVSLPFAEFVRRHEEGRRRMTGLFGSDNGWRSLYAGGEDSQLLGRPVSALLSAESPPARVALENPELFADVRPSAPLVPSLVTGQVIGGLAPATTLAVAVNGRVQSLTNTVQEGDNLNFTAVAPPSAFRRGANRLEVFEVKGEGGARRLVRLSLPRTRDYRLVERNGATVIAGAGQEATLQPTRVKGHLEELARDDQVLHISGWAADFKDKRPVQRVLVFAGDRLIAETHPTETRDDVVKAFDEPGIAKSGFRLTATATGVDVSRIRVFAVSGDAAARLTSSS